jgi:type VII secretion integral membrane protein EccD
MTVSHLCRVTVQTHCGGRAFTTDVTLPSGAELGEVLPSVVDIVGGGRETDMASRRWHLCRFDGSALDESKTLQQNGVCDGQVLTLTTADTEPPVADAHDLWHAVANASGSSHDGRLTVRMNAIACLWAGGVGAVSLALASHGSMYSRAVIAAIVAATATTASIVAGRIAAEPLAALALGATAAAFAAVAGFLAVPGGPAPPNFLLAAVVCAAVSTALVHVTPASATYFIAISAFSTIMAIAAAVVSIWPAPVSTVGAFLAAASVALLSAATKLSILLTGLSPAIPDGTGDDVDGLAVGDPVVRAINGHRTLTGLLTGFSAAAAVGAALVATDHRGGNALGRIGLTAVVAVVLLLRSRQQLGTLRSSTIYSAGMISATATFTLIIFAAQAHAQWICLAAALLGIGAVWLAVASPITRSSPVVRRSVDLLEYLALGLIVPMSCWVGDVFGLVRGSSLP